MMTNDGFLSLPCRCSMRPLGFKHMTILSHTTSIKQNINLDIIMDQETTLSNVGNVGRKTTRVKKRSIILR